MAQNNNRKSPPIISVLLFLQCAFPCVVFGKDLSLIQALEMSLEELLNQPITVASKFEETNLEVGSTVAVIPQSEWQKRGARRLHDAIGHLPGVIALPALFGGDNLAIRGYAYTEPTGIATLLDGVSVSTFQSGTAQWDRTNFNLGTLDSIEMIRGPGSAVYGTDAFHGVFSLQTFASTKNYNRAAAEFGSNGFYDMEIKHANNYLDPMHFNIAAAFSGQPDQNREYQYTDVNDGLVKTAERKYKYQSDTVVAKLNGDYQSGWAYELGLYWDKYKAEDFPGFGAWQFGGESRLAERDISSNDSEFYMNKFAVRRKFLNSLSAEVFAYYWQNEHTFEIVRPATRSIDAYALETHSGVNFTLKQAINKINTQWSVNIESHSAEIDEATRTIKDDDMVTAVEINPIQGLDRKTNSVALAANTAFLNNEVRIHYGGRVDNYSDFGTHTSPRLGVIWHAQKRNAVKLLYGNAFRAPNAVELNGTNTIKGNPNLEPETIDTFELVFMEQSTSWKSELAFFRSFWHDAIVAEESNDPNFSQERMNLDHNNAKGVELSTLVSIDQWLVDFSSSFIESENAHTHTKYVAFPKWIINLGTGYIFTHDLTLFVQNRIHLGAYEGPITDSISSPEKLKDYWRTDLNLTKDYRNAWQAYLNVRNLFDRDNYLPSVENSEGGIPDERFSVSLGGRYKW